MSGGKETKSSEKGMVRWVEKVGGGDSEPRVGALNQGILAGKPQSAEAISRDSIHGQGDTDRVSIQ